MKKHIIFLFLFLVIPYVYSKANDSTGAMQYAIQAMIDRPDGMSEAQAAVLILNPGKVDSLVIENKFITQGFFFPFSNRIKERITTLPVFYDGTEWRQKSLVTYSINAPSRNIVTSLGILIFFLSLIGISFREAIKFSRGVNQLVEKGNYSGIGIEVICYQDRLRFFKSRECNRTISILLGLCITSYVISGTIAQISSVIYFVTGWVGVSGLTAYLIRRLIIWKTCRLTLKNTPLAFG